MNLLAMGGMLVSLLIIGIVLGGDSERKRTLKRIDRIKKRKPAPPFSAQDLSLRRKRQNTRGILYWLAKPLPDFKRFGVQLQRAGVTMTPKQYVMRRILTCLGLLLAARAFGASLPLALLAGLLLGVWMPLKLLQRRIGKQQKAFLRVFPDGIDLIVRGLRSGLPVSESIVLVSSEVPAPVGATFGNIANKMKLGVTLEKALQETAQELGMTEFNFFTTCIVLQRETGGNLSEILNNLSEVLRSRFIMRMKIRALSSEARASSYIIGALPFVVILAVSVMTPEYMKPLIEDSRGNVAAMVAAGMMFFGMWTMNRMTNFEF